ncbi:MAG: HAD hydrolase-like protein [Bdellovibrionales bacterium]
MGDTDHDLEVAQALGIDVTLVEHGHQCPTRLRDIHHCVLKVL